MSRRLFVLPAAQDDIAAAAAWYDLERSGLGRDFLERIDGLLQQVTKAPYQFPTILPGVRRGLTRRFPYGVYFMVSEGTVNLSGIVLLKANRKTRKRPMPGDFQRFSVSSGARKLLKLTVPSVASDRILLAKLSEFR